MRKGIILLGLMIGMISCEKDSVLTSKMTAFIDGDTWKSITQVATNVNNVITVTGTDMQGRVMAITIHGDTQGTYELNLTEQKSALLYKASPTNTPDAYASVTGKVIITAISSTSVSGTFDFTCSKSLTETIQITNGQFNNVRIVAQP